MHPIYQDQNMSHGYSRSVPDRLPVANLLTYEFSRSFSLTVCHALVDNPMTFATTYISCGYHEGSEGQNRENNVSVHRGTSLSN